MTRDVKIYRETQVLKSHFPEDLIFRHTGVPNVNRYFFFPSTLQRGGKIRVDMLRVSPGEEWAFHKAFAGGRKSQYLNCSSQLMPVFDI